MNAAFVQEVGIRNTISMLFPARIFDSSPEILEGFPGLPRMPGAAEVHPKP
jgi:hypothetical protein